MNATLRIGGIALLLLAAAGTVGAAGVTYRWVDAGGHVHYGDQPPPNVTAVPARKPTAATADPGDDAARPATDPAECARRTQKLDQYRTASSITETDSLGNKREFTEAERQKLIERTEQSVRDGGCTQ